MKKNEKYNIGLDIGTTSVGWAVTDLDNNMLKIKGKNMWGARLFEEAKQAKNTRVLRCSKRRLRRRKERIKLLQQLIGEDIIKEYPDFFKRLKEASYTSDDKTLDGSLKKKYNLFSEVDMDDKKYYKEYPTIYHLREHLIKNDEKMDIRLVYLAIHHILKYRGNFLYENQDLESVKNNIKENLEAIIRNMEENFQIQLKTGCDEIVDILNDKTSKKGEKKDKLMKIFNYEKENKIIVENYIKAFLGYKFKISKLFEVDCDIEINFSQEDDKEDEIFNILSDEEMEVYCDVKGVYEWYTFNRIKNGKEYISEAFIEKYEKYKRDLNLIKKIYREYSKVEFDKMFRNSEKGKNYYTYDNNIKECSIDDLYKEFNKILDNVNNSKEVEEVRDEIKNNTFLRKLNTTENASLPYQLHLEELKKILDNQSKFYPKIKENRDKIIELMTFRIPYYVGPLTKSDGQSRFSWLKRKSDEKVLPWNFEEVVDVEQSAEEFIKRMTKKCSYLVTQEVLPKNSILYSEFCLLNELANIRINGRKISKELKRDLVINLFGKRKKVTVYSLKKYLIDNQKYDKIDEISGLSQVNEFNTQLCSYNDMNRIVGDVNKNIDMIEEIIEWISLFEDKKILKRKLIKYKDRLNEEQIGNIVKLKYKGWGNLSRKLLDGIKSLDNNETIIEKLRNTDLNFMQIINKEQFGFVQKIDELMPKLTKENITYEDIENLQGSPAIKKGIWQTIRVVKEIVNVMGSEPQNIYIEFARNEEKNKKVKDKRAVKLKKIYDKMIEDNNYIKDYDKLVYKELKQKMNEKEFNEKMLLYFIQNGKCLYSQKKLEIDNLSLYEVDHILPQSYIKDDSISNKALVIKEENQRKSNSLLLEDSIINKNEEWWKSLYEKGLIDSKKLRNLIRRTISLEQKEAFISRQLVETRQIIKHVTNLLCNQYENTDIFAIRAELISEFRKKYKLYKNRNLNNYHHAQDALFATIIGNESKKNFYFNKEFKYDEHLKKYEKLDKKEKSKLMNSQLILYFIGKDIEIERLHRIMNYKDCFVTKKIEEQTGEFYKQTITKKSDNNRLVRLKIDKPVEKYGGRTNVKEAYSVIAKYDNKKGKEEIELIGIPIQVAYDIKKKKRTTEQYLEGLGYRNVKILKDRILKYQTYINENNEKLMLRSSSEIKVNKPLLLNYKEQEILYKVDNYDKLSDEEKYRIEKAMIGVYRLLLSKMKDEYKIFDSIEKKLEAVEDSFEKLKFNEKRIVINQILDLLKGNEGDFRLIGVGTERSGRMKGKTFKKNNLEKMIFLEESVTGIFERRYTINGMENSCCKE